MTRRIGKPALAVITLAILALAAYWYWSPFLAIRAMQKAAQAHDAAAFSAHVDYPRVRASLKEQVTTLMADKIAQSGAANNPLKVLGSLMGGAVVDRLVDATVRPETVMGAMQSGQFGQTDAEGDVPAPSAPASANVQDAKPTWSWTREGTDKLVAFQAGPDGKPREKTMRIVFERSGFASWKVTALRLAAIRP